MPQIPEGHREVIPGEHLAEGDMYFSPLKGRWVAISPCGIRTEKNRKRYNPKHKQWYMGIVIRKEE